MSTWAHGHMVYASRSSLHCAHCTLLSIASVRLLHVASLVSTATCSSNESSFQDQPCTVRIEHFSPLPLCGSVWVRVARFVSIARSVHSIHCLLCAFYPLLVLWLLHVAQFLSIASVWLLHVASSFFTAMCSSNESYFQNQPAARPPS